MACSRAPGAQAQDAILGAGTIYADLVVNTSAQYSHRICRRLCLATPAALLAAIAALHDHVALVFRADVLSVDVSPCTPEQFAAVRASPLHFVNVCGKVTHCRASHVLNPAVLPLVVSVRVLYSPARDMGVYSIEARAANDSRHGRSTTTSVAAAICTARTVTSPLAARST